MFDGRTSEPGTDPGSQHNYLHTPYSTAATDRGDNKSAPRALLGSVARLPSSTGCDELIQKDRVNLIDIAPFG
jgi:hypothetical protein